MMYFDLVRPCADCPFRTDLTFYLHPQRTQDILRAILEQDQTFTCHNSLDYTNTDEEGIPATTGKEQHCAGALIMAERLGIANQLTRIAERLGLYDRHKLQMDAPVFATPQAMVQRMQELHQCQR